jgi:uncharacterized protein (DUF1800 family)
MLLWLNGVSNTKWSPNENYGREMMELFTLGQGRGYGQQDVHDQARALTGWTNDWSDARGPHNFRFEADLHDDGVKMILGRRGRFTWSDSCRLCVEHRSHPTFMVTKLWGYFVADPVPADVLRILARAYVASGYETQPLVEAILRHPLLLQGERMVIPPAVYCAGMLRALGRTVQTDAWSWIGEQTGQKLLQPPNVAGWDYAHWLDTARWAARLNAVNYALADSVLDPDKDKRYSAQEGAVEALDAALAHWGDPELSGQTRDHLLAFGRRAGQAITADWEQVTYRVLRQNALRALIPTTPDWQTC